MEQVQKVYAFLKESGTFYIATVDGDRPRVRPFGAIAVYDGRLYSCTNNRKQVFAQMQANPHVEISGMANGKWIRLEAEAVVDTDPAARAAVMEACPELKSMYSLDDGIFEVFYLKNATASFCSFTEEPEVVRF